MAEAGPRCGEVTPGHEGREVGHQRGRGHVGLQTPQVHLLHPDVQPRDW